MAYGTKGGTFGVFDFQKDLPKRLWDIGIEEGLTAGISSFVVTDFTRVSEQLMSLERYAGLHCWEGGRDSGGVQCADYSCDS